MQPLFSFVAGKRNINGRYLEMTFVKEKRRMMIPCTIFVIGLWFVFLNVLLHWQDLSNSSYFSRFGQSGFSLDATKAFFVFLDALGLSLCSYIIFISFLFHWPGGKGWTIYDNAYAKWYGTIRKHDQGHYLAVKQFYFPVHERHFMKAEVYEDKIAVCINGRTRKIPYDQMFKTFKKRKLFVIRARHKGKVFDIILDTKPLEKQERKEFLKFIKRKKKHEFLDECFVSEPWVYLPEDKGQRYVAHLTQEEEKIANAEDLPLGTVVTLEKSHPNLMMIYARNTTDENGKKWDYRVCPLPEGYTSDDASQAVDSSDICEILFLGLQPED